MKTIDTILYCILIALSSCSSKNNDFVNKYNDLADLDLRGKVKELVIIEENEKQISTFNKNGNLIESFVYDKFGDELKRHTVYEYNDKNKLVKKLEYNNGEELDTYWNYQYDQNANLIKTNIHKSPKSKKIDFGAIEYFYNSKGEKSEAIYFNSKGEVATKIFYKYDTAHNLLFDSSYIYKEIKGMIYEGNSVVNKYNNFGNKLEEVRYYDTNRIICFSFAESNNIETMHHSYDKHGNRTMSIMYDIKGKKVINYFYKYDTHNNIIEFIDTFKFRPMYKTHHSIITYDYDVNGNWIKKTEFEKLTPEKKTERKISYY